MQASRAGRSLHVLGQRVVLGELQTVLWRKCANHSRPDSTERLADQPMSTRVSP